jgi:hypothetical protein
VTDERLLPAVLGAPSADEIEGWRHTVKTVQKSPAVPEQFRNKPQEIFAVFLMGRELGLPPMRSLQLFDVIEGRTTPRAELLTLLATRAGHKIEGDANAEQATVRGTRGDTGAEMVVTVTYEEMAKVQRRGKRLVDGDNWKNYPADMLWARAVSRLVRRLCPDVLSGSLAVYATVEELPATLSQEVIEAPALDLSADDAGNLTLGVPEDPDAAGETTDTTGGDDGNPAASGKAEDS